MTTKYNCLGNQEQQHERCIVICPSPTQSTPADFIFPLACSMCYSHHMMGYIMSCACYFSLYRCFYLSLYIWTLVNAEKQIYSSTTLSVNEDMMRKQNINYISLCSSCPCNSCFIRKGELQWR